jgi:hypothetical protein
MLVEHHAVVEGMPVVQFDILLTLKTDDGTLFRSRVEMETELDDRKELGAIRIKKQEVIGKMVAKMHAKTPHVTEGSYYSEEDASA